MWWDDRKPNTFIYWKKPEEEIKSHTHTQNHWLQNQLLKSRLFHLLASSISASKPQRQSHQTSHSWSSFLETLCNNERPIYQRRRNDVTIFGCQTSVRHRDDCWSVCVCSSNIVVACVSLFKWDAAELRGGGGRGRTLRTTALFNHLYRPFGPSVFIRGRQGR